MDQKKLTENIIDQIKEAQLKLGYARETVRLYYPAASLAQLLETEAEDAEELLKRLEAGGAFRDTVLGTLQFAEHAGRIEVRIPPEGAEYVHREVPDPEFLKEIIELFGTHHHCSLEEIRAVFAKFSEDHICEKMPEGMDFDYVFYFPDGSIDPYYYCVREEMEHTIYHRFTKEDFQALMRLD